MEKIITIQNLRNFAYCNNSICRKPIRGIVAEAQRPFRGKNGG